MNIQGKEVKEKEKEETKAWKRQRLTHASITNNIRSRVNEDKKEILRWQSWGRTKKLSKQIRAVTQRPQRGREKSP